MRSSYSSYMYHRLVVLKATILVSMSIILFSLGKQLIGQGPLGSRKRADRQIVSF